MLTSVFMRALTLRASSTWPITFFPALHLYPTCHPLCQSRGTRDSREPPLGQKGWEKLITKKVINRRQGIEPKTAKTRLLNGDRQETVMFLCSIQMFWMDKWINQKGAGTQADTEQGFCSEESCSGFVKREVRATGVGRSMTNLQNLSLPEGSQTSPSKVASQ